MCEVVKLAWKVNRLGKLLEWNEKQRALDALFFGVAAARVLANWLGLLIDT